jgi:hypothetical protein
VGSQTGWGFAGGLPANRCWHFPSARLSPPAGGAGADAIKCRACFGTGVYAGSTRVTTNLAAGAAPAVTRQVEIDGHRQPVRPLRYARWQCRQERTRLDTLYSQTTRRPEERRKQYFIRALAILQKTLTHHSLNLNIYRVNSVAAALKANRDLPIKWSPASNEAPPGFHPVRNVATEGARLGDGCERWGDR